jgi:hypothetical protein
MPATAGCSRPYSAVDMVADSEILVHPHCVMFASDHLVVSLITARHSHLPPPTFTKGHHNRISFPSYEGAVFGLLKTTSAACCCFEGFGSLRLRVIAHGKLADGTHERTRTRHENCRSGTTELGCGVRPDRSDSSLGGTDGGLRRKLVRYYSIPLLGWDLGNPDFGTVVCTLF